MSFYKGHPCGDGKLDFHVEARLIVELKTIDRFADILTAQVMAYLKATRFDLGLLLNFNVPAMRDGIKAALTRAISSMMCWARLNSSGAIFDRATSSCARVTSANNGTPSACAAAMHSR